MVHVSLKDIQKVANLLETGYFVYIHKQSGKIVAIPEFDDFMDFEDDRNETLYTEVDQNPEAYMQIKKMSSRELHNLMMDFALEQENKDISQKLVQALRKNDPITQFMGAIRTINPEIRNMWQTYKDEQVVEHVRQKIWIKRSTGC
ncbi:hypothetical protein DMA11_05785 [Marinilabiliaceae bacterium JC017]|nr:hypothetical protein DMA11_05785 [Marinilabiliaceae bacterium JC017]